MLAGCAASGWVLHLIAQLVSGQPDPSYAYPLALRLALGFAVLLVTLVCSRFADTRIAALGVWLWMALLAVVCAALLPGLSPYFLFPALIASVIFLVQSRLPGAWTGALGQGALLLAAIPALVIWLSLTAAGESVMGLSLHPLFTVPAAFAAMTLLPLVARPLAAHAPRMLLAISAVAALALGIYQGIEPAYSARAPQRLSIAWVDDHISGRAYWLANTAAKLPPSLRAAADFSAKPVPATLPLQRQPAYVAQAGKPQFAAPTVAVASRNNGASRMIALALDGSDATAQMALLIPKEAGLRAVTVNGKRLAVGEGAPDRMFLGCMSSDCRSANVMLEVGTKRAFDITVAEIRFGLPPSGDKLVAARPDTAVRSQNGDNTIVLTKIAVPGG